MEKPEPLERAGITNPSSKTPNEKSATSTQGLSSSPNPLNAEPHTQEATHIADSKSTSTLKRSASVSVDAEKGSGRHSGPGVASEYKNHKKAKTEVASTDNGTEADGWEVPIKSIATRNMLLKADSNKSTLFLFYEATYKFFVCYHEKEGVAIKSDCPSINLKSISGVTREPLSSGPCFVRIETDVVNDEKRIFDIVLAQRDQGQAMLAKVKEIAGRDSVLE